MRVELKLKLTVAITFVLTVILLITKDCLSQEIMAIQIKTPIKIDGVLDEEAWQSAKFLTDFNQFEPDYNEPASFPTRVMAVYDKSMIYFAFECTDPEPARITARATKRDGEVCKDDAVAIFLDTFDDNNSGYMFKINPLATQKDMRIADNGRTMDLKWDETWYAAAEINDKGWTCEIGIPFKSLKYNKKLSAWGFRAGRWISRLKESHFTGSDFVHFKKISQFGSLTNLQLEKLSVKKYTFIPYIQGEFKKGTAPHSDIGLDVRFNPVSNIGLSFTLNPDFATIEGDVEQVNLTRFELRYPEKRPFFLEGAENYSTRIRQFYSRRIGEIPWGAKVNGKIGKWNINGLTTRSDPTTAGAAGEKGKYALYSVFRVNREFPNGSTIGLIGANRQYRNKNSGSFGLSGTLFFSDVLGMTTQMIKSHGSVDEGTWTYFIRPAYDAQFTHFHVRYSHYGTGVKENMNVIGFIRHDDRKEFDTNLTHTFWLNKYGFDSVKPSVNYNQYWSQNNYLRSRDLSTDIEISYKKKFSLELSYDGDFKAEYMPYFEKDFYNHAWGYDLGYDNKQGFSANIEYCHGRIFDSKMEVVEGGVNLKILEGWNLTYRAEKTWLQPSLPDEKSWIHYIRTSYYVNNDLYFKLFYQTKSRIYGGFTDLEYDLLRKTIQVLFVWRFFPPFGSLQLVYQEGTTRHTETIGRGKSFFTKLSWVF